MRLFVLSLTVLALWLAGRPVSAQTAACVSDWRVEEREPPTLARHRDALRALSGRVDLAEQLCPPSRLGAGADRLAPFRAEGSIEEQQTWDRTTSAWTGTGRILRALGDDGRLAERVRQLPAGTGWVNDQQTLYALDGANQIQTDAHWDASDWIPTTRATYFYRPDQRSLGERQERWDADAALWRVLAQRSLDYDAADRVVLVLTEALREETLETLPVDRTLTSYAADDRGSVVLYQRWADAGRFADISRTTLTADADGVRLASVTEERQAGEWVPSGQTLYLFGSEADTVRTQTWSRAMGAWENTFQTIRSDTESGQRGVEVTQSWQGDAWINVSRSETETEAGRLVAFMTSVWEGAWVPRRRLSRAYVGGDLVEEVTEQWQEGAQMWGLLMRSAFPFHPTGAPLRTLSEVFAEDGVTLRSGSDTVWEYDALDRPASRVTATWDPVLRTWVDATRSLFTYGAVPVATEVAEAEDRLGLAIAPNPAATAARLELTIPASAPVRVDLFSVTGRLVQSVWNGPLPFGRSEHALDLSALAPGLYLVRVGTEAGEATRMVTVAR